MQLKVSPLKHKILNLLSATITAGLLCACSPNLTVLGTIDESLLLTKEEIHTMGFENFKKEYLGKEVTITGVDPLGKGGGFNSEKGQCYISYDTPAIRKNGRFISDNPIKVGIYANKTPSYALKKIFSKGSYIEGELDYDQEVNLPMEVCTTCEWNERDKSCFYNSPNTIITGKIIKVGKYEDQISMVIRPKGLAY
jgi:hypothetical protein